jgi:hypothetical protein
MKADPLVILMIPGILLLCVCLYLFWNDCRGRTRKERLQAPHFKPYSDFTYGQNGRQHQRK